MIRARNNVKILIKKDVFTIDKITYLENVKRFIIKNNHKFHSIHIDDIYYFETFNRKINIMLKIITIKYYGSFLELEKVIDPINFVRCHKSYIVNINKILTIDKDELSFKDIESLIYVSDNYKIKLINKIINN